MKKRESWILSFFCLSNGSGGYLKNFTHGELCKLAASWLKRSYSAGGCGCSSSYIEVKSGSNGGEIVDAIGLKTADGTEVIVVEAKVSRGDFFADKKKPFRQTPGDGMGDYRYYICPEGLIDKNELPEKWGLLYVGGRGKINVVCGHYRDNKDSWRHKSNRNAEMGMAILLLSKAKKLPQLDQILKENTRLIKCNQDLMRERDKCAFSNNLVEITKDLQELTDGVVQ